VTRCLHNSIELSLAWAHDTPVYRRYVYTKVREAETAARFGYYTHAVQAYEPVIDAMQQRKMDRLVLPKYLFSAGLCWAAAGAWGRLDGHIAKAIDMLPEFEKSEQCAFLQAS
jgi:hypothetical protein